MNFDKLGGRRFLLSYWCIVQSGILVYFGKIDSGTYGLIILAVISAYIAGNVTQKIKGAPNDATN